jgi:hypothetical protein
MIHEPGEIALERRRLRGPADPRFAAASSGPRPSDMMVSPHGQQNGQRFSPLPGCGRTTCLPWHSKKSPTDAVGGGARRMPRINVADGCRCGAAPRPHAPSSRSKANQRSSIPSRGRIHSSTIGRAKNARRFARPRSERRANPGDPRYVRPESHRVHRESCYVRSCLPVRPHRHKQRAGPPASAGRRQSRQQERICVSSSFPYRK